MAPNLTRAMGTYRHTDICTFITFQKNTPHTHTHIQTFHIHTHTYGHISTNYMHPHTSTYKHTHTYIYTLQTPAYYLLVTGLVENRRKKTINH